MTYIIKLDWPLWVKPKKKSQLGREKCDNFDGAGPQMYC